MGHDGGMTAGGMPGMTGGWMLLWASVGVAFLVVAGIAVIWPLKPGSLAEPDGAPGALSQRSEDPSAQELRRRYAAGGIDREEYLWMQSDLSGG